MQSIVTGSSPPPCSPPSLSFTDGARQRCLSPEILLKSPPSSSCDPASIRVQAVDNHLLTIDYTSDVDQRPPQTLVWSGARSDIRRDVQVSRYGFRGPALIVWMSTLGALLVKYATTLSASLALLNVLPLPKLDGSHILGALCELLGGGAESRSSWLHRLSVAIKTTTAGLVAFSLGGQIILAFV